MDNKKNDAIIKQLIHDLDQPFILITIKNKKSHFAKVFSYSLTDEELLKLISDAKELLLTIGNNQGFSSN